MIIQRFEKKIKIHRGILNPLRSSDIIEWSEEEIRQQEKDLLDDSKAKEYNKSLRIKRKIEKKVIINNLFCRHKETREQNGFLICLKCGGKWKVKNNGR